MILSRYMKSSSSFGRMAVLRFSLIRIYSFPHSFRISLSVLNMSLYFYMTSLPTSTLSFPFCAFTISANFLLHAHDIGLLYLPPRYTLHNHHSEGNHGNPSGILSRSFRFFLPCGHKARYFFLLPPLFKTSRYRSASAVCFFLHL